jgi:hypothetical protein
MIETRRSLLSCEADCKDGKHSTFCIPNRARLAFEAAAKAESPGREDLLLALGMLSGLVVKLEHER